MQITRTTPSFTGLEFHVVRDVNKGRKFLYNEVLDVMEKNPVPATFKNDRVVLEAPDDSNNIMKLVKALQKKGIKITIPFK